MQLFSMRTFSGRTVRLFAWAMMLWLSMTVAAQQSATNKIVRAANTFLDTLDAKQKKSVMYAWDDEVQRAKWSNFPTGFVPRGGISLKQMTPVQRKAAMALMAATLSPRGMEKVEQIMEGDEITKVEEAKNGNRPPQGPPQGDRQGPPPGAQQGPPPGGRGGRPQGGGGMSGDMFGKDLYYLSFLGTPSAATPWMLQFGGHHLALNITIAGEQGVLTPTLTGAQPAMFTLDGKTVRPLGRESDKAFALLQALDEGQKKKAVLSYQLADLVLGPGQDGKTIVPEGLKVSTMTEHQKTMLLDVIAEWAGIIHESAGAARMAQLKADLNETWFSWSGPTTVTPGKNITAYYRIQGPHLVIEYAPQTLGGDAALHVHTMYRDPTNDYGRGLAKQ